MGEHKYNPTAIAAKNGELPPKFKPRSKRETERIIYDYLKKTMPFYPDGYIKEIYK